MSGTVRLSDDWGNPGWTHVPTSILRDAGLSWKAKGLVAWLASHEPGFRINREFIYRAAVDGATSVEAGLKELRLAGYLRVEQARDAKGKLAQGADYILFRTPVAVDQASPSPSPGFPVSRVSRTTGFPSHGKPGTKKTNSLEGLPEQETTLEGAAVAASPEQADLFDASGANQPTAVPSKSKGAGKRATTAPDSMTVTDRMRTWAQANAIKVNLESETESFLDHHRAKGTLFKDWEAGWRKWMRNSLQFGTSARSHTPYRNGAMDYSQHGGFGQPASKMPFPAAGQYPSDPFAA